MSASVRAYHAANPDAMKQRMAPRRGVPLSAETKRKLSEVLRARYADPAERAKQSERAKLQRPMSDEERARRSAAQLGKRRSVAAAFHLASARIGVDPALMAVIHSELASMALKHGVSLAMMRDIARSKTLLTATPREKPMPPPVLTVVAPEPKPAGHPAERPCMCCRRPIAYERNIRLCTECKARA